MSFHHCRTYHGSGANRSDRPRRAVSLHLQDGDNEYRAYPLADGGVVDVQPRRAGPAHRRRPARLRRPRVLPGALVAVAGRCHPATISPGARCSASWPARGSPRAATPWPGCGSPTRSVTVRRTWPSWPRPPVRTPTALLRLLRALAYAGLLRQPEPGRFALTAAGNLLRSDVDGSVHLNALMQGDEVYRAFAEITHTLRTGEPAFEKVFGLPFYEYLDVHPTAAHTFHESMGAQPDPRRTRRGATCPAYARSSTSEAGPVRCSHRCSERHPEMRGVLAELPGGGRAGPTAPRRRWATGWTSSRAASSTSVPAGGDAYVLCRVLHNWRDDTGRDDPAPRPGRDAARRPADRPGGVPAGPVARRPAVPASSTS